MGDASSGGAVPQLQPRGGGQGAPDRQGLALGKGREAGGAARERPPLPRERMRGWR